jgi:hypothetical protein
MKTLTFSLSLIAIPLAFLSASTPNLKQVSSQANWVAHLDFQSILRSKIGSALMAEAQKDPEFTQKLNGLKAVFGLDLEKLGSATAYGSGKKDEGTVIVKGGINSVQIEGFAALNDNVSVQKREKKTLYSFKKGAFCSLGSDSIIASTSNKLLVPGLDVLAGKNPSQKNNQMIPHLSAMMEKPMAIITIRVPRVLAILRDGQPVSAPEAAIMKKADLVGFAVSEEGSAMRMAMAMQAENEETAEHLENVLRGGSSLLALGAGIDIDRNLDEILPHIKTSVSRQKRIVGLQLEIDSAFLLKKIREEMAKKNGSRQENKVE